MAGNANKRSTIYFDKKLHKVLRLKAAETHRTVSDLINEAVRRTLLEDQTPVSVAIITFISAMPQSLRRIFRTRRQERRTVPCRTD